MIQELIEIGACQTFIISYLKYQSSTFKTLKKKNEKSSRFENFRRFRGFALHYESAELAEGRLSYSSENIKNSKEGLTPCRKVIMGSEYLVWEGKERFRGFHELRGFRGIDLADDHVFTSLLKFSQIVSYNFIRILSLKKTG